MKNKHIGSTIEDFMGTLSEDEKKEMDLKLLQQKRIEIFLKNSEKNIEKFLNDIGCTERYPKSNIRIYFYNEIDESGIYITEFEVVEFDREWFTNDPERAEKVNRRYRVGS